MLGKVEGSRKRGRPNTRLTDSLKEAISLNLQEMSRSIEDGIFWRPAIHRVTINQRQLDSTQQQLLQQDEVSLKLLSVVFTRECSLICNVSLLFLSQLTIHPSRWTPFSLPSPPFLNGSLPSHFSQYELLWVSWQTWKLADVRLI